MPGGYYDDYGQWVPQTGGGGGGSGSVTSVALTAPPIYTVAGSPVTTGGTLALTLATQSANQVWAGPSSGSAAAPTFRSLATADLPAVGYDLLAPLAHAVVSLTATGNLSAYDTLYLVSGSATITGTLPAPSAGKLLEVKVASTFTGAFTLAHHSSETIDGAASRVMMAGESAVLYTDGTNWLKLGGQTIPQAVYASLVAADYSVAATASTPTPVVMDTAVGSASGSFSAVTGLFTVKRAGIYTANGSFWGHGFPANSVVAMSICQNGNIVAPINGTANTYGYAQSIGGNGFSCAAGDTIGLYVYPPSTATITLGATADSPGCWLALAESPNW